MVFSRKLKRREVSILKNVKMTLDGNILTIQVDVTKDYGPSSSGKTNIVATTEGGQSVEGLEDVKVNLTVYKKVK